jgi:alanyl-tRNA synthetase
MISTDELRNKFLNYFQEQGHAIVPSSSLVPANDPTLLFTNAGMVQFKDIFLGREHRTYTRATSVQRCLRVSGKHNDFENVGYTARHQTFFEMLGNFSFGDYFKREAIHYAWDFLTNILQIPQEKLWATVFEKDDEAADIWLKDIGINPKQFVRCGASDNFWAMGDTGPCGPCSEIFYDYGEQVAGGPPGSSDSDGDRYTEIWNLVFMQFNRDSSGNLIPLPKPSIDTGMGLERLATVIQGVYSNYDIDLFQPLIKASATLTHCKDSTNSSLKVLADHIRACSFLILDGILPSNEGRGYVLRRIIRRAARHGYKLGIKQPFFHKLVEPVIKVMGNAYPELNGIQHLIERLLLEEETQFAKTLSDGLRLFEQAIQSIKNKVIPGKIVFKLCDTYGFPQDLTADIAKEKGLSIDQNGFEQIMAEQRKRSKAASQFQTKPETALQIDQTTEFIGYDHYQHETKVLAILRNHQNVDRLNTSEKGQIILDRTPFYAESGGQAGDSGELTSKNAYFQVQDTQKIGSAFLHIGTVLKGSIQVNDTLHAKIDIQARKKTAANHSATHLMHKALQQVLGKEALQKGSLVDSHRLRLDFSHTKPVIAHEIQAVEKIVNQQIQANLAVTTHIMSLEEAKAQGATALFGEKYGEKVRVVSMGDFSTELCGGTHVRQTGDIGFFKIISETGIAAGIRRIEATTGETAVNLYHHHDNILREACSLLKTNKEALNEQLKLALMHQKELEKSLLQLQNRVALFLSDELIKQAKDIMGTKVIAAQVTDVDLKGLHIILDHLKSKLDRAVIVLALIDQNKVHLLCGVTKPSIDQFKATELIQLVAEQVGGKGGGKADTAQGSGIYPEKLPQALQSVEQWVSG